MINPSMSYMVMILCAAACNLVMFVQMIRKDEKRVFDSYKALIFFFVLSLVLGFLNWMLDIP